MALDVDEAGRDHFAARVDAFRRRLACETARGTDGGARVTPDADVTVEPRVPRPVDDFPAGDDDVVPGRIAGGGSRMAGRGSSARREREGKNESLHVVILSSRCHVERSEGSP